MKDQEREREVAVRECAQDLRRSPALIAAASSRDFFSTYGSV
jgi:hypothetical protein